LREERFTLLPKPTIDGRRRRCWAVGRSGWVEATRCTNQRAVRARQRRSEVSRGRRVASRSPTPAARPARGEASVASSRTSPVTSGLVQPDVGGAFPTSCAGRHVRVARRQVRVVRKDPQGRRKRGRTGDHGGQPDLHARCPIPSNRLAIILVS
jgi:hypothetical protein